MHILTYHNVMLKHSVFEFPNHPLVICAVCCVRLFGAKLGGLDFGGLISA